MQAVRLPLMSLTELLNVVRPSGLLSPDAILDAIKVRSESRDMDLNYRGMLSKYLCILSSQREFACMLSHSQLQNSSCGTIVQLYMMGCEHITAPCVTDGLRLILPEID